MRITITGRQGEGKTLVAEKLAEILVELGWAADVVILEKGVKVYNHGYDSRRAPVIITVEHT